jgi:uncharacterized protein with HEPN domain
MTPDPGDYGPLWDMLESADAIVQMVAGMSFAAYQQDRRTRRAVEREIEIIGEAARSVSKTTRESNPQIPWRKIISQRHILAHEYGDVQDELIWRVATIHIPALLEHLRPLVPPPPADV